MKTKISRREFAKSGTFALLGTLAGCRVKNRYDLILKNGHILDGTGSPAVQLDLAVSGNKISAIADLTGIQADRIVDVSGLVISPGFIDIHTHTDIELLVNPNGESKVLQGVTSEISGNCGSSPFPLTAADSQELDQFVHEKYGIHTNWHSISGFFEALQNKKISINYASFTGHGSLRAFVVGKNDVDPTTDQMNKMCSLLEETMQKGSFGLSSGLEYTPGSFAKTDELIALCKVVHKRNGVYATHMRNEDDTVAEAVDEALRISQESGVSLQIAHLKAGNPANWHKMDAILSKIQKEASAGIPVTADRYPYIAYGTSMSTFLPQWARQGNRQEVIERLEDTDLLPRIKEYTLSRGKRIGGWDRFLISYCSTQDNKKWQGKSIKACIEESGKSPFEFIRTLLIEEKTRAGIVGFAMDEENLKQVLSMPLTMVASDGNAVAPYGELATGKPHPRYYGTFPRVLGKYCREEKCFDLATAIKKMTSMPARKLGLQKRGIIVEGNYADLTVFNPDTVEDKATFTDPHQPAAGIEYVVVNGQVVVEKGKHTGAKAGTILKHQHA